MVLDILETLSKVITLLEGGLSNFSFCRFRVSENASRSSTSAMAGDLLAGYPEVVRHLLGLRPTVSPSKSLAYDDLREKFLYIASLLASKLMDEVEISLSRRTISSAFPLEPFLLLLTDATEAVELPVPSKLSNGLFLSMSCVEMEPSMCLGNGPSALRKAIYPVGVEGCLPAALHLACAGGKQAAVAYDIRCRPPVLILS